MIEVEKGKATQIASLFDGWNETLIWTYLQGHMGRAWADTLPCPASARIIVGDFCFLAGMPKMDLVRNTPAENSFLLMTPQKSSWSRLIERQYAPDCEETYRYAIKKEPDVFDRQRLESYIEKLPHGFRLSMIDEFLFHLSKNETWSQDFCSQFPSYGDYWAHGIGVMALHGDTPVSGASSYTFYDGGIEIEIDTKSDYRNRGLALACASKLILECLDRGLYPSWDACDLRSVALAEKLGYHLDHKYVTYLVRKNR